MPATTDLVLGEPRRSAESPGDRVLRVRGLCRDFGRRRVVGPVTFDVAEGESLALVGPNGSGKSTILRCIAGTLRPTDGEITVGGHRAGTVAAAALLGVSLSQERSFDLRLTAHANLLIFARLRGISRRAARQAVDELEEELELRSFANERVSSFSTGMTQQLALARSLLGDPAAVLLDEPTRSLDADARERLWEALGRRRRLAVVIATHRDDDIERCRGRLELGH